jgi:integrase
MPRYSATHTPQYRLHKPSGQAVVTIAGKVHYLGKFTEGTDSESRQKYNRLLAEWFAAGQQPAAAATRAVADGGASPSVDQIIAAFWVHAQRYYCTKDGEPTSEVKNFRYDLRYLRRLYGATPAAEFGPKALKSIQAEMIRAGLSRKSINRRVKRIRHVFKWAVSEELLPPSVIVGLATVAGLKRDRTDARETADIRPESEELARAAIAAAGRIVGAMIELQLLSGMRSGELIIMRTMDIDRSGEVWTYTPSKHKTEHHGHTRTVFLGAREQEILTPLLKADPEAFLFSPAEADRERRAARAAARKTPLSCGNRAGTNRSAAPKKTPGARYEVTSYCKSVYRACAKAFPVPENVQKAHRFHPHQLRHAAATQIRRNSSAETARVLLGHRDLKTTEIYAEIDHARAREYVLQRG